MRKIFLPLLAVLLAACQSDDVVRENAPDIRGLSAAETQITTSSNNFAFNLFKRIQKEEAANSFISPFSVSTALAMTLNGAGSETQQSILGVVDYGAFSAAEVNEAYLEIFSMLLSMDSKVDLGIANSVWHTNQYHVKNSFSEIIKDYYDGTIQALDFTKAQQSKDAINGWVAQKTNNRIKNLIEDIDPHQVMFLVNAIYFKGEWTHRFDKGKTAEATFTTPAGSTTADIMHSDGVKMNLYSNSEMQLIDIPYGNEQFSLTVLMPHEPTNLQAFINTLNAEDLAYWLSQAHSDTLALNLPKFKMEWKSDLKKTLVSMGMKMQDLPNLFEETLPLEISAVIHQSFLDVNEEGSEAAAATAVGVVLTSVGQEPPNITINKSFVFMIREKHTGAILFMGQLVDPDKL